MRVKIQMKRKERRMDGYSFIARIKKGKKKKGELNNARKEKEAGEVGGESKA